MKAYDLKPTDENLLNTLKDDTIERNASIFNFIRILDSLEDSCSIALEGNWGSGKTFFVKQTKMILDALNQCSTKMDEPQKQAVIDVCKRSNNGERPNVQSHVCVYYDAWKNDNDDDPVLSLVYTILQDTNSTFSFTKNVSFPKVAANILEFFSGRNWSGLIENLQRENPLDALKELKNIEDLIAEFLDSLLAERGNRLVVFIDELDRCKPSYAVKLLERIKHYFSNDRITFVFSVNIYELQHTIRKFYGDNFNGGRYLDRFFDLRISLPPVNLEKFYRSINFGQEKAHYYSVSKEVIKIHRFELREITRYVRILKIATHNMVSTNSSYFNVENSIRFCVHCIVPIMIGLKIADAENYLAFIQGNNSAPLVTMGKKLPRYFTSRLSEVTEPPYSIANTLEKIYRFLFAESYDELISVRDIGNMRFNMDVKNTLLRVVGLLSEFTTTDID
ncbi:MAG: KAP family NTPase [Candidatus Treponema excrementipullorum]|uniref:KAP family NTPase n=1 Tax=Candidatus Treponema excrementipullorum TaxID=2838768 RepID=A0A9E2NZK2_9SPIR|nr:KAP family NTPase [Candidatus Treponema excrementipullorum]